MQGHLVRASCWRAATVALAVATVLTACGAAVAGGKEGAVGTGGTAPAAGDRRVLEGVERIGWDATPCLCFVGSAISAMHYLGEEVANDYAMGVSGGAFKEFWIPPWDGGNCDLLRIGEEPIRRTFAALGYEYTLVASPEGATPAEVKERLQPLVVEQIDAGRPVIAIGVVGPPEACVVTGYERGGDVLLGWSYFQEDTTSYFSSDKWFENCHGLILIGEKKAAPSPRQVLQDTLEWAIELTRPGTYSIGGTPAKSLISGTAAYEAMAQALEREEEWQFAPDDQETMELRCFAISNDGVHLLTCERNAAARFLKDMADQGLAGASELRNAAEAYEQEVKVLEKASALAPFSFAPEGERRKLLDPEHRSKLAKLVRESKAYEERALEHLERAHRQLTQEGE